jgi:hypothetical protein
VHSYLQAGRALGTSANENNGPDESASEVRNSEIWADKLRFSFNNEFASSTLTPTSLGMISSRCARHRSDCLTSSSLENVNDTA